MARHPQVQRQDAPSDRRQAGFTLLELMVALALVALMAAVLLGGVRFGARVWERSHIQAASGSEVHAIRRFLRERMLAVRAVGAPAGNEGSADPTGFSGDAASLRFVSLMPDYVARGGLYQIEIDGSGGGGEGGLTLAWWPYGGSKEGPGAGQRVLLAGTGAVRVSYFGDPENAGDGQWLDAWPESHEPPRLISIKVSFPAGDPRVWPELVVPLPTAGVLSHGRRP
ncbi:MAG: prepilin-type N-terminal cleavage/methylation domain-containing protein [Alphaproteobacteria bacterium]|nr:prepilin-type N-terminal cleavage/methylation domain-containing protein [Alphaproteobacteria bacterium]